MSRPGPSAPATAAILPAHGRRTPGPVPPGASWERIAAQWAASGNGWQQARRADGAESCYRGSHLAALDRWRKAEKRTFEDLSGVGGVFGELKRSSSRSSPRA